MATCSTENIKLINPCEVRVHAATPASSHNISYVGCRFSWLYVISFSKSGDSLDTFFFNLFIHFFFLFVFGDIDMKRMMFPFFKRKALKLRNNF